MPSLARRILPVVLVSGAIGLSSVIVTPIAGAATPSVSTFTISGALKGKLSETDPSCEVVNALKATIAYSDFKLTGGKLHSWLIVVTMAGAKKQGGTSKSFSGSPGKGTSFVLENTQGDGQSEAYWTATSGTLTTTATGGHVNLNLSPGKGGLLLGEPGKGNLKVAGSWGCSAPA